MKNVKITNQGADMVKKKKGHKLMKGAAFSLLLASALSITSLIGPYVDINLTNEEVVNSHKVENTINFENNIADNEYVETYAVSPYEYDGDIKAFIEAPGIFNQTYPVMQGTDNNYYLSHDVNGQENGKGSICKDCRNGEGLSDDLTVIYGHNLIDNSMMGKLSEYSDKVVDSNVVRDAQNLYNENHIIDYKDAYGHYEIDIFASGVYDANFVNDNVGKFANEEQFNNVMQMIQNGSDIDSGITPSMGDKIVCFFTCLDGDDDFYYKNSPDNANNRVLVFGVAKQLEKYQELPNTNSRTL